ncbi:hypothetical protein ACO1O0_008296 [Amphichorda felina]
MADSKTKPTTKGPYPKSAKESKVWSLVSLAREVAGEAEGIHDYSNLVEQKKKLEYQLKERSNEVLRLNQELENQKAMANNEISILTSTFGERYKVFDQNNGALEQYQARTDEAKAELKKIKDRDASKQSQLSSLEIALKSATSNFEQLQKKNKSIERDCVVYRSQLQAVQDERDDLEAELRQARNDLGHGFFYKMDESRVTIL